MKIGFLITARLKSTRLKKKIVRELNGRPILAHMIDRLKRTKCIDDIVVCTSTNKQDRPLVDLALSEKISYYCGDEEDVLQRLYDATVAYKFDYILNITADCPFVDPVYADRIVAAYRRTNADLILAMDLPHGAYSYGIRPEALAKVLDIKESNRTEVWGRYFTDTDLFQVHHLPITNAFHRRPQLRMTLDYPEDLEFFRVVFENLYQPGEVFSLDDILNFLEANPEVTDINSHCADAYKHRWNRQSAICLKPRYETKRAAIVGCGSIGLRHIRNLKCAGITRIMALRSRRGHTQDLDPSLGVRETADWRRLIDDVPDIAIISNPTSLHLEAAMQLVPHVKGLFIEKPLAASMEGVHDLVDEIANHRAVSFIGYNLHFHPVVRQVNDLVFQGELGRPLSFQAQVGQYLPDWHPYEDYRNAYYARKELGGGVTLTLIHEIDLAMALLGPVTSVFCSLNSSNKLALDVDVISDLQLQHACGAVSQIHLDYIQRPLHRCGTISYERGWIGYDLIHGKVVIQSKEDAEPKEMMEGVEGEPGRPYLDEMQTFLKYVSEGRVRHGFDVWRGVAGLAIVEAAFASARSGRSERIRDRQSIQGGDW